MYSLILHSGNFYFGPCDFLLKVCLNLKYFQRKFTNLIEENEIFTYGIYPKKDLN